MARAIWSGAISFGLVSIPVRLAPATSDKDIAFNELHAVCHSKMSRKRWCPTCDREVPSDEVIKGYPFAKNQWVELTDEDFEKVPLPSKHAVEVVGFVRADEIDPVYYEKTYLLEPEDVGVKAFGLFMHALREKQMTAVAKIAIRKKEQLCAMRARGPYLLLSTLFYADEVRLDFGQAIPEAQLSDAEERMAFALVDMLTKPFVPGEYNDAYREKLFEVINAKLEGREFVQAQAPTVQITDLMEALRLSLEQAQTKPA
jgi:DNA end-binding protein Ku